MTHRTTQATGPMASEASTKLPAHLRFHTVRRDLPWTLPTGWEWCGPVVVGALFKEEPSFLLSCNLWPLEVQERMDGVVLVSSVLGAVSPETSFNWAGLHREATGSGWLHPRKPRLLEFPRGHALRIGMAQCRQGELLMRPVRKSARACFPGEKTHPQRVGLMYAPCVA